MTIINGIEIDTIRYVHNSTKEAIVNNEPIDTTLHVIMVVSNPCLYATRYILAKEFIYRMEQEPNVTLYVVELAYGDEPHHIAKKHPRHLQLRTKTPIWHKENMINIGVRRLLPPTWKALAWIDADLEFESSTWALDTLKILNGSKDVIQLFSHCIDMDKKEGTMNIWSSFGYQHCKQRQYCSNGKDMWHPGYAWAITRRAFERMEGLYENSILGAGDHNMALAFIGHAYRSVHGNTTDEYKQSLVDFQNRSAQLRLGYVPGIIRHYYHGTKANRKYNERWSILVENKYVPAHFKHENDILVPTENCPPKLLIDIMCYFKERNEDDLS